MILVKGTGAVEGIMLLLTRKLDRFGLRVNEKKVELWTVEELQKHRCRDIQAIFANQGDKKNPKLVRQFVDAYFKLSKKKLAATWNGGQPLLNRLVWANIESLPEKVFNKLLSRLTARDYLLRAEKEKLVRVDQLNKQRIAPIDLRKRMRELGITTMHNAFHHECLGFAREVNDRELIAFFTRRLSEIEAKMDSSEV